MSKTLKTAAIVVGGVALIATGIGAAAALGAFGTVAAGSATAAFLATAATVATVAGFTAAALGAAAALTAKKPGISVGGDQTKWSANKDQGIPWVVGRTSVAGWIVHRQTWDYGSSTNNAYQTFVAIRSGMPTYEIESFSIDGSPVAFSGDTAVDRYAGYMWLNQQQGPTPASDQLPAANFKTTFPGWTTASKLSGCDAYALTLKWDDKGKKFPSGPPEPTTVLKGAMVWDPRKDSTYPGGEGPHRPDDPTTWEFTENGPLLGLAWARGLYQNGKRVMGIGFALASITVPAFVEAANVADANEWTCGGVVYSTDSKWDNLKKFMATASAEPIQLGGSLSCTVDTPRVSLATITTADIIGDWSVTATPSSRDRFNGVIPRYRSEDHGWELVDAELVQVDDYVATDGRTITRALPWELVQDVDQVAELALYQIVNAREFGPIVTPLKIKWIGYKPGDCLTIVSPELGMDEQDVIVLRRNLDPGSGAVTLTMRSETTAKHAFALGQTGTPPPTPSLQVVDREQLQIPGYSAGWTGVMDDDPEDHPRPEDGATNGATLGENIKDGDGNLIDPVSLLNSELHLSADGVLSYDGNDLGAVALADLGGATTEALAAATAALEEALDHVDDRVEITRTDLAATTADLFGLADGAVARIADAVLRLGVEASKARAAMRDAGIYVDPATGTVHLYGVDEALGRLSTVDITLDAVKALISAKASTTYVDNAIAVAALDPSAVPIFTGLEVRIAAAELELDGLGASLDLKASIVDLTATDARVTTAEENIDALAGEITTKVDSTTFDALDFRVTSTESQLLALGDTAAIRDTARVARMLVGQADDQAELALASLLNGDLTQRRQVTAVAEARRELVARIVDGEQVEAFARTALAGRVAQAEAGLIQEALTRVNAVSALAQNIVALSADITFETSAREADVEALQQALVSATQLLATDLRAVHVTLYQQGESADSVSESMLSGLLDADKARRQAVAATASARQEITARIVQGETTEALARTTLAAQMGAIRAGLLDQLLVMVGVDEGLAQSILALSLDLTNETSARTAAVTEVDEARIDGDAVLASRIDSAEAAIADEAGAREAAVTDAIQASVDGDAVLATQIATVATSVEDEVSAREAAVSDAMIAIDDGDSVLAARLDTVETTVDGHTASVEEFTESINGLLARWGIRIDVNGHIIGIALNNDGDTGGIDLVVDYLRAWSADGLQSAPFLAWVDGLLTLATDVNIRGDVNVMDGTLTADQFEANGVTRAYYEENADDITLTGTMEDLVTVEIEMLRPGTILVMAEYQITFMSGGSWSAEIAVDDEVLKTGSSNTDHYPSLTRPFFAPTAGTYTVKARASGTSATINEDGGCSLTILRTYT